MLELISFGETEAVRDLSAIVELVRTGAAQTRSDIQKVLGLGRGLVAERVGQLLGSELLVEGAVAASTGGRASRQLELNVSAGLVLCLYATLTDLHLAVADLSGVLVARSRHDCDFSAGPEVLVETASREWNAHLSILGRKASDVWGIGASIPAHIDFEHAQLIDSPSLPPAWFGYPFAQKLAEPFGAPFWMDTDTNVIAYGEVRAGAIPKNANMLYLSADMAIGCGIVVGGKVYRGAQGGSGNIGHITGYNNSQVMCRCGRRGCVEAQYGGEALVRRARTAAEDGSSPALAKVRTRNPSFKDLSNAVQGGDTFACELVIDAGVGIGQVLAASINMFNPSVVLVGGRLMETGNLFLASLKEAVYRHCLPFVTSQLQILQVAQTDEVGLVGAAHMVIDHIVSPELMARWFPKGTPRSLYTV